MQQPGNILQKAKSFVKISIVTTLFNSEPYISEFYDRCAASAANISDDIEFVFVNDGSKDRSMEILIEKQKIDSRIVIVDLSRNFGHHPALMTGLHHSTGDYVVLIDSDLEENPELIELFWREHCLTPEYDVISAVQRKRKGHAFERISGMIWYRLFDILSNIEYPADMLTARFMTRRYVDVVTQYKERELEIFGVFAIAGFSQRSIAVDKGHKGTSTYNFTKKIRIIINSITSFSSMPLTGLFLLGLLITTLSFFVILYLFIMHIVYNETIEGWVSTLMSIWFSCGILVFSIGIIGIYLSRMFTEIKGRPLTSVRHIYRAPLKAARPIEDFVYGTAQSKLTVFADSAPQNYDDGERQSDAALPDLDKKFARLARSIPRQRDDIFSICCVGDASDAFERYLKSAGYKNITFYSIDESQTKALVTSSAGNSHPGSQDNISSNIVECDYGVLMLHRELSSLDYVYQNMNTIRQIEKFAKFSIILNFSCDDRKIKNMEIDNFISRIPLLKNRDSIKSTEVSFFQECETKEVIIIAVKHETT
jgi:putative glycosyltransferase